MLASVKKIAKKFLRKCIKPMGTFTFITSPHYYQQLQDLLIIAKPENFDLVRIGHEHDGGYIMLNDFHNGDIAYSFGISNDVSWDKDMVNRGCEIFMYDHTIDNLPEQNPNFHWNKLGIADGIIHDDRLKTLDELIASNHHENAHNMINKCISLKPDFLPAKELAEKINSL